MRKGLVKEKSPFEGSQERREVVVATWEIRIVIVPEKRYGKPIYLLKAISTLCRVAPACDEGATKRKKERQLLISYLNHYDQENTCEQTDNTSQNDA